VKSEVVITGFGVVCPIGIGREAFWTALLEGRSGVRRLGVFERGGRAAPIGAEVTGFDPKQYVRPRKSLKVMSRDIVLGFAAADLACVDAQLAQKRVDPERIGIVLGADLIACELDELVAPYRACMAEGRFQFDRWGPQALAEFYPLWMLKYLPNMPACHIGIAQDIRGPTNSIVLGEVSSLAAVAEGTRAIERGQVDAMIAGGVGMRIHPTIWTHDQISQYSQRADNPAAACRPFDAGRDGIVNGEGAAALFMESRASAEARGATILARVLGFAAAFEPRRNGTPLRGTAIRTAIRRALDAAGLRPGEVGHVNAHGASTTLDDPVEAQAIRETLGDVPVTAPKSCFGDLGAGGGAVELGASLLALVHGQVPPTLNYEHPDPLCPVNVVRGQPLTGTAPTAVALNHTTQGQAVAVVLGAA